MDPLSITAGIITVTSLIAKASQSLKGAKILRGAPAEFDALINEVSDLQIVSIEFHNLLSDRSEELDRSRLDGVHKILQSSKDALLDLDSLIHYRLVGSHDEDGNIKVSRLA